MFGQAKDDRLDTSKAKPAGERPHGGKIVFRSRSVHPARDEGGKAACPSGGVAPDLTRRAAQGRERSCSLRGHHISTAEPFNPRPVVAARQRATIDLFVAGGVAIIVLAAFAFSSRVFIDGDTNWHVASGRWILTHMTAPTADPFSFTYAGKPWIAHEWGSEVLMALAYLGLGWSGVVLLMGAAAGTAYALIAAELRLWLGPVGQLIGLGLSFACLQPFLYARPHILALPLLVIWTSRLLAARRAGKAPPLELALLMVLWANLHASFIFGLGIIGPFAAEAFFDAPNTIPAKLDVVRGWGVFGVIATALSLATPHGIAGLEFPFWVLGMKVLPNILEWRSATFQQPTLFEGALLITLFLGLWRGVRVPPFRLVLLVALVHMALQHVRQEAVLAVLAPMLLAEPFGRATYPGRPGPRVVPPVGWKPTWRVPSVLVAWPHWRSRAAAVVATRLAIPLVRTDNGNVPVTALAHVPPQLLGQPVFNEYAFGGYLIFKGVKPYIDGRADMYGDAWVQQYLAIAGGAQPTVDDAFKRWNIRWTILSPREPLVRMLDTRPGWRRIYADGFAVVHARADALDFRRRPAPSPPRRRREPTDAPADLRTGPAAHREGDRAVPEPTPAAGGR